VPERSGIDYSQELPRIQTEKVGKELFILFYFFMGTTFNGCNFSGQPPLKETLFIKKNIILLLCCRYVACIYLFVEHILHKTI